MGAIRNEVIEFAEWVAKEHFYLYNVEGESHYWRNESLELTTKQLFDLWKRKTK